MRNASVLERARAWLRRQQQRPAAPPPPPRDRSAEREAILARARAWRKAEESRKAQEPTKAAQEEPPPPPPSRPYVPPPAEAVGAAERIAATIARRFEGLYLRPYLCPAGVPTIGYGATHYEDGRRVRLSDPPISRERAETLLVHMLRHEYLPAVRKACPGVTEPGRLGALLDFTFNVGSGNLRASTLRKKVNGEDWDEVPEQLRRWNKGGGRVLKGLVRRREAEIQLI